MKYQSKDIKRKSSVTIFLFLIMGIALVVTERIPVSAQATPEISVLNPLTGDSNFVFYTNLTSIGYHFNVTVWVSEGTDVVSWQVNMTYNPTLLNATGAWVPSTDPEYIFLELSTFKPPPDLDPGGVVIIGDLTLPVVGVDFTTPKILAIIEFEIIYTPTAGEKSSDLDIDNAYTFLVDSDVNQITTTKTNGYYQYTWVARLDPYLEAKPWRYDATKLETFNITVWLNNIASEHKLVNITFQLRYDATLLNVTQVIKGPFLAGFGATTFNYTDEAGNLTVVNYLTSYTSFPEGDGEITIITFQGIYQDAKENYCSLELFNIQFLDDNMNPVPFSPPIHSSYRILPAASLITMNVNPLKVAIGSNVTISGTITPIKVGVNVTIYYKPLLGEWATLSTVITDIDSRYTYIWTTNEALTFKFKASWAGDDFTLGAESDTKQLEIILKEPSTITIIIDLRTVVIGENITITGTIQPLHPQANVTINYRPAGETDGWIILATVETDSQGSYTYTWITPEMGKYEVMVNWLGDASTLGAESEVIPVEIVEKASVDIAAYLPYILGGIAIIIVVMVIYFIKGRKR